jgi:hypothetical protein
MRPYADALGLRAALAARRELPDLPVLVLSQYVEQLYARELLAGGSGGIGYLLKDRVLNGAEFADAVRRVAAGGTAMDPEVVARLLTSNSADGAVAALSPREREVLSLMAEGRSNPSPSSWSSPSARSPSTPPPSSCASGCRHQTTTTAACWPSSPTSGASPPPVSGFTAGSKPRPSYLGGRPGPGRMGGIGDTGCRRGPDHRAGTA